MSQAMRGNIRYACPERSLLNYRIKPLWLNRENSICRVNSMRPDILLQGLCQGGHKGNNPVLIALASPDKKLTAGYITGA